MAKEISRDEYRYSMAIAILSEKMFNEGHNAKYIAEQTYNLVCYATKIDTMFCLFDEETQYTFLIDFTDYTVIAEEDYPYLLCYLL